MSRHTDSMLLQILCTIVVRQLVDIRCTFSSKTQSETDSQHGIPCIHLGLSPYLIEYWPLTFQVLRTDMASLAFAQG